MKNVEPIEKDYLTPLEAARYWSLSKNKFYLFINSGTYSFVVLYRKRKLILREEFDKYLSLNPKVKETLQNGRNNKKRFEA